MLSLHKNSTAINLVLEDLESILNITSDGDHRSQAQNLIIQLSTKEPTEQMMENALSLIDKALLPA
jgi:hypothetical protein